MVSSPRRELARAGPVQVFEYRCTAARGDLPVGEQFSWPAISFVKSGVFGFRSEQRTQLLSEGFLLLGSPGRHYEVSHEHCGGDRCLIFRFDEAAFDELAGAPARTRERGYFHRSVLPPQPRLAALRQLAEERLRAGAPALGLEEVGLAIAACVLSETGNRLPPRAPALSRSARDSIHDALQMLERRATEALYLDDFAATARLSAFHFLRLFKRETGVTPYRFLMQRRVRLAIELLRDSRRPITDIAFDVGFGDLSNFINAFRREVGCSPSQFRKAEPVEWAQEQRALEASSPKTQQH